MIQRRHTLSCWLACLAAITLTGCRSLDGAGWSAADPVAKGDPVMRVRIMTGAAAASFDSADGLWIGSPGRIGWEQRRRRFASPVTVTRKQNRFNIASADGSTVTWQVPDLMVVGVTKRVVRVDGSPYPHTVVLHSVDSGRAGRFDVVNHVRLEAYLPGVLHKELPSKWSPAAFRAQAIAARCYALRQASRRRDRRYDLESTTADQVYAGLVTNHKAIQAVRDTEGIVLTYNGELVPTYYSSTCGGTSQDAAAALKDAVDIPPLRGGARGGWCQQSKYFRWGPIKRPTVTLVKRIAAWGKANGHKVAALKSIRSIGIAQTNAAGRPTGFVITDANALAWPIGPEQFRFACNFDGEMLPKLAKHDLLRSSHVRVAVEGQSVHFTDGRGFGHGVGLCQWGAQAMAAQGRSEYQILEHYYPGADATRAY